MSSFDDLISSLGSQGSSAWSTISDQLAREGADQPAIVAAQNTFTTAWNSLSTTFGMNPDDALTGAQQYTFAASTASGAVSMVEGLTNDIRQASTPVGALSVVNMFTGSLIGIAVAAGAVSAGVGAVVVAAVALAGDLLQSFLGSPPGIEICPGVTANPTPDWVVACTPFWGTPYSPGQLGWRSFPIDPVWFTPPSSSGSSSFSFDTASPLAASGPVIKDPITGQANTLPVVPTNSFVKTPIEELFPEYASVVTGRSDVLAGFHQAFISAWKANKEYALNGQKVQSDASVLQHQILIWNRAHSSSSTVELTASSGGYEASLVPSGIASSSSALTQTNAIAPNRSGFTIHIGPRLVFVRPLTLTFRNPPQPPVPQVGTVRTPTTATTSTALKVVAVAGLVGVVGAAIYAHVVGVSFAGLLTGAAENPIKSATQTLIFSRQKYSVASAKSWARSHGYKSSKVDVTAKNIRLRQHAPSGFRRMRTVNFGHGIRAVIGFY